MTILEVRHIAKAFKERKVLIDVSMKLEGGKAYGFVGTNGSGKTTLFNIISNFLSADKGEILYKGKPLEKTPAFRTSLLGISRTFQDLRLVRELTVLENILLSFKDQEGEQWWKALLPKNIYSLQLQELNIKAEKIIEQTFLGEVKNQRAGEISYGQQKLLTLACCLANDADLLLLDEPVAGINPVYKDKMAKLINEIKESGKTILLIEHNAEFIEQTCDKVFFLSRGVITEFGSYSQLRQNQEVQEAYI